jgi:hypothetical protein
MTPGFKMIHDENEQLYPERSTTAFMIYHSVAKYLSVYGYGRGELAVLMSLDSR